MKRTPKNFVILCLLNFIIWTIFAMITVPRIFAYTSTEDSTVAIALAIAVATFGAAGGFAIAKTGSAAISALAEKPEVFIRAFMIVSLAEAVAIYGLLLGIMLFSKLI
jgi:V/A-type H+-transporting ATPase subunit K